MKKRKYRDYDSLDFIKDEFFIRWVKTPTKESSDFWEKWIASHPEKHEDIVIAKRVVESLKPAKDDYMNEEESLEVLDEILTKRPGKYKKSDLKRPNLLFLKIAAAVIFVLLSTVLIWKFSRNTDPSVPVTAVPEKIVKSNPMGQRSVLFLGDGSKVTLSYGSTITYQKPFDENQRVVSLEGEAFFEIARDEYRLFKVLSANIVTEALGTSFNVNSRARNNDIVVSLISGKIRVGLKDKGSNPETSEFIINPGEQISYDRNVEHFSVSDFVADDVISWKDGVLVFRNAGRNEVLGRLKEWYGVEIIELNKTKIPWNLTARFDNQSLEKTLNSIGFVMKFDFEINEKKITLKYR